MNVLIASAGRRVSLVTAFRRQLKNRFGADSNVFTTDLEPGLAPACLISDGGFKVGRFTDPDYIDVFLKLCLLHNVKLVVPTLDTELALLARERGRFHDAGIKVAISDFEFVAQCRDKRLINKFFVEHGFEIPQIVDIANPTFPLFIKPFDGSSSQNIFLVKDESMLAPFMRDRTRFMHMEYLSPKRFREYTVDMYYDKHGHLKCLIPRVRIETRGGEVSKGITQKGVVLDFLKRHLPTIKGARGCITLQLFHEPNEGRFFGIEVNPRFGGGYPLSDAAGGNYPTLLLDEYLSNKSIEYFESWQENLLMLRHDSEHFIRDYQYP